MIPVPQPPPVAFDPHAARRDFPLLGRLVHGKPLVYLDNAATTQKPQAVLDALRRYYLEECSNIHRGVHELSVLATRDYESARGSVRRFLHAAEDREIVFVRGATEGINLVMASWGRRHVGAGDEVVITAMDRSHKCRRLHGHSFRVELVVAGPCHPRLGWVMDYADISTAFEPIWKRLKPRLPLLTEVVVAETAGGRGIVGVIDGNPPKGVETPADVEARKGFLRMIGYKLG